MSRRDGEVPLRRQKFLADLRDWQRDSGGV